MLHSKYCVQEIDSNKQGPVLKKIKHYQIDRLRSIFNKLSATKESQQIAKAALLEKLLIANKDSPELLSYTLFKISSNIVADCQEEFFNETDESHPLKLARVSCGLCVEINTLKDTVKAQFYHTCPMTIPRNAMEGLTGDSFYENMRFRGKPSENGITIWETKDDWLARMSKLLCTFSVMIIQPEQTPFTLLDGWQWLSLVVNSIVSSNNIPFYSAMMLEVFLRVTANVLFKQYGELFMLLLKTIQLQVIPLLGVNMHRKEGLEEFLSRFINSHGNDFMSLFQKAQ